MGKIKYLSKELINKIAAGEVVERPASVLKELLENSIDAGGRNLIVEVENGGVNLIKVSDDGVGMSLEDALLSLERYSTSKISEFTDLENLDSYGFRGEALASIAAVSKFSLETKNEEDSVGVKVEFNFENSRLNSYPVARNKGTTVEVRELFFNVPARRKFLKTTATEYRTLLEIFLGFALLHFDKTFTFIYNQKEIYHLLSVKNWEERVKAAWEKNLTEPIFYTESNLPFGKLKVFLGHPAKAQNNKKHQLIYVNKRLISDIVISKALREAYGNLIPRDLYPIFIVDLEVIPNLVDVNVHPRKSEVKFINSSMVYQAVYHTVNSFLQKQNWSNEENLFKVNTLGNIAFSRDQDIFNNYRTTNNLLVGGNFIKNNIKIEKAERDINLNLEKNNFKEEFSPEKENLVEWKILGQIRKSFILVESGQGLIVIDQHAAAERILYEKLKQKQGRSGGQNLLVPLSLELSPVDISLLIENESIIGQLGFILEKGEDNFVKILTVPEDLNTFDIKALFLGILSDLEKERGEVLVSKTLEDKKERLLKYAACRGAIKFNDVLNLLEIQNLVKEIRDFKVVSCPHGRPAFFEIKFENLEHYFGRC